jgi:integrase
MSIYKRGKTWWVQFTDANGERVQRTAGTKNKQEAQEFHDRIKAESWRQSKLGQRERHTWQEAVVRWVSEQAGKTSLQTDIELLRWLDQHLSSKYLDEIDVKMIQSIQQSKITSGAKNGTVNRVMALLRAILNRCEKEWQWIDKSPYVRMLPTAQKRIRWITHSEASRLMEELPDHLKAMVRFTLATGLRESNVTGLQWSQLDMQRRCAWIHPDEAKANKAIAVPLNKDALAVIRQQIGKNESFVFTYEGSPVTRANNHAWRKALKRADIENFRWHDLRHTWASWHVQNGTPLHVLKELGGWADLTMVLRYAHLSSDHLHEYSGNSEMKKLLHIYDSNKKMNISNILND